MKVTVRIPIKIIDYGACYSFENKDFEVEPIAIKRTRAGGNRYYYSAVVNNLPIEYFSLLDEKKCSFMKKVNNEFGLYDTFNIIRKDNKKFKPPIFEDGQDIVILS